MANVLCSVCKKVIGKIEGNKNSHGYCKPCGAEWLGVSEDEYEKMMNADEKPKKTKTFKEYFTESEDIKIGDTILTGRFKNSPAVVKGFGTDKNNQPTVKTTKGEISLYKFRISKLMKDKDEDV
jgi:hypothetical protein